MALCHNGNLTNAIELRRQLENEGAIFHGSSDTCLLYTSHHGHHCHRDSDDHVGEQQKRCKVIIERAAQGKAAQHCQRNKGQIQPAICLLYTSTAQCGQ